MRYQQFYKLNSFFAFDSSNFVSSEIQSICLSLLRSQEYRPMAANLLKRFCELQVIAGKLSNGGQEDMSSRFVILTSLFNGSEHKWQNVFVLNIEFVLNGVDIWQMRLHARGVVGHLDGTQKAPWSQFCFATTRTGWAACGIYRRMEAHRSRQLYLRIQWVRSHIHEIRTSWTYLYKMGTAGHQAPCAPVG